MKRNIKSLIITGSDYETKKTDYKQKFYFNGNIENIKKNTLILTNYLNKNNDTIKLNYIQWIKDIQNFLNNTNYFKRLNKIFDLDYYEQTFPRDFYRKESSVINLYLKFNIIEKIIYKEKFYEIKFESIPRFVKLEIMKFRKIKLHTTYIIEYLKYLLLDLSLLIISNILSTLKFVITNFYIYYRLKNRNMNFANCSNIYFDYITTKTYKLDKRYKRFYTELKVNPRNSMFFHRITNLKINEIVQILNSRRSINHIYTFDTYTIILFFQFLKHFLTNLILLPELLIQILQSNLRFKILIINKICDYLIGEEFARNYFSNYEVAFIIDKYKKKKINLYYLMENQNWEYALNKYFNNFCEHSSLTGLIYRKIFYWDNRFFFAPKKNKNTNVVKFLFLDSPVSKRKKNFINKKNLLKNSDNKNLEKTFRILILGDYDYKTTVKMLEIVNMNNVKSNHSFKVDIKFHPLKQIKVPTLAHFKSIDAKSIKYNCYDVMVVNYYSSIIDELYGYKNRLLIYLNPAVLASRKNDFELDLHFFSDLVSYKKSIKKILHKD